MTYAVKSLIICDGVRRETNGKQILIGIYVDEIIFGTFPAQMPQLMFRVAVDINNEKYEKVSFLVRNADETEKSVLIDATGDAKITDLEMNAVFVFGLRGVRFPKPGKFLVEFGLDGPRKKISEFVVRPPKNPKEVGALHSI